MMRSIITYASKTWELKEPENEIIFERNILIKIIGPTKER